MCKRDKKNFCDKLYEIKEVSREEYYKIRENIVSQTDPLKKAIYYFLLNRCSFNGGSLSSGYSKVNSEKRFNKASIKRIENLDLSKVNFKNQDYADFINKNFDSSDSELFFLDPPYVKS